MLLIYVRMLRVWRAAVGLLRGHILSTVLKYSNGNQLIRLRSTSIFIKLPAILFNKFCSLLKKSSVSRPQTFGNTNPQFLLKLCDITYLRTLAAFRFMYIVSWLKISLTKTSKQQTTRNNMGSQWKKISSYNLRIMSNKRSYQLLSRGYCLPPTTIAPAVKRNNHQ